MSQDTDPIDDYFTRQIVGEAMVVDLGPSTAQRVHTTSAQWVEVLADRAAVAAMAARTLFNDDASAAHDGRPFALPRLQRWRRRWLVAGVSLWSVLLVALCWWLARSF